MKSRDKTPKENMRSFEKKWRWKCPVVGCDATGRKLLSHSRAQHGGKCHILSFHGKTSLYPIMIKKEEGLVL